LSGNEPFTEILPRSRLQPHTRHFFEAEVRPGVPATHVRFAIFPDGGVSRLRLFGTVTHEGRLALGLAHLNRRSAADAEAALLSCCGATQWARLLAAERPFRDLPSLRQAADLLFAQLRPEDWLEAFSAHPRIGEHKPAARWSAEEQAAAQPDAAASAALRTANHEYERRFGHLFIVCATGKSATEMLGLLHQRLLNPPHIELPIAAEEQRKIMNLRLEKLLLP
jgi:allantoicase